VDNGVSLSSGVPDFFLVSAADAAVVFSETFTSIVLSVLKRRALRSRRKIMALTCRRCDRPTEQALYRVTTEDAGVIVLNILVCSSCARLAKRLGLPTIKLKSRGDRSDDNPERAEMQYETVH
jgi:hypothetical protein